MIWLAAEKGGARESGLTRHVREVIAAHGGDAMPPDWADEVSKAVSAYVEDGTSAGIYVDSDALVLLTSRAMSSVGQKDAAQRVLVFGCGVVTPSTWELLGSGTTWTLDFGRLTGPASDASLELVFFGSLQAVLASIAEVWDETAGAGTLALRHARAAASSVVGKHKGPGIQAFVEEIRHTCLAKLHQLAGKRTWQTVPDLLLLEVT